MDLVDNVIGDDGIVTLVGALPRCVALVRVNLANNDIYEEGTRTLETVLDDGRNAGMHVNLRTNNIPTRTYRGYHRSTSTWRCDALFCDA